MRDFKTYNGWANYATWKLWLEVFSDKNIEDIIVHWQEMDEQERADALYFYAKLAVYDGSSGIAQDLALDALRKVDFNELATVIS
jgi:hypothetical protein